jgi:hypothetical protein
VDEVTRGGDVVNKYYETNYLGQPTTKYECGWVPTGLNQSRIWDEKADSIPLEDIYTGTVAGPGSTNKICGQHNSISSYGDINCTEDKTTHGYWNKDHAGLTVGETDLGNGQSYTSAQQASFAASGLFYWEVQLYDPSAKLGANGNPAGTFGVDWYGDYGMIQSNIKKGDRIYVRKNITNRHQMAMALAIEDTEREIHTLFNAATGVKVGNFNLTDVFKMNMNEMKKNKIIYSTKHSKL